MKKKSVIIILISILIIFLGCIVFRKIIIGDSKNKEKISKLNDVKSYSILYISGVRNEDDSDVEKFKQEYFVIFDKEGKVIDTRVKEIGHTKEMLTKKYDLYSGDFSFTTNASIREDILYYNMNVWNGDTKEEVISNTSTMESVEYIEI